MTGSGASFIPQKNHGPLLKNSFCQQLHMLLDNQMILKRLLKKNSPPQDAGKDLIFTQLWYFPFTWSLLLLLYEKQGNTVDAAVNITSI